jgi:Right handed beta helix region
MSGTYYESVTFPVSGTAASPITFLGQSAIIDGTGVPCCTGGSAEGGNDIQGLINIINGSYITISGFEIRNYTTSQSSMTPAGIWVTGSGAGVVLSNNLVHDITTTSERRGNAFGISVYGTSKTPISYLTISGNQVYNLRTGQSESVTVDGNVTNFAITNNIIHDNDNIGIDIIGFEGVGPTGSDQAKYGEISGNLVYNISAIGNPGEGNQYDADGLYCDGCAYVTFERNTVHDCDLNMEAASEHSGHNSSYVTIRNNVFYNANAVGVSIGGYSNKVGGSDHAVVINNTLYNNNTQNLGGEFQIQYHSGSSSGNIFENNIVYAGQHNVWIYSYVRSSSSYPAPPATMNNNLYFSAAGYIAGTSITWAGNSNYNTFAAYQSATKEDLNSEVVDPVFVDLSSVPPDLDITSNSPAVNAGSTILTCAVGYCNGNSIYGSVDVAGTPRTSNTSQINIGAYQATNQ